MNVEEKNKKGSVSLKELELEKSKTMKIEPNLGITEEARKEIADSLMTILSSSYHLLIKTQNYHWNIRGILFKSIHELTEDQYKDIFDANDVIAERIRALGYLVPGSFQEFANRSILEEEDRKYSDMEMIYDLVKSHEALIWKIRNTIDLASDALDESTADMLTGRLRFHEKNAWMLRSFLEQ